MADRAAAQPVGDGNHVVKQGECIESIALAHGFLPDTLWNHPDNAQLKRERKDPSLLLPGDRVQVPDPRLRQEQAADGQKHRFRRKGLPSKLHVRILRDGEPRKDEPYTLNIDGKLSQGTTDGDGVIEVPVPPNAQRGTLIVGKDEQDRQTFELQLSGLDPLASVTGAQQRLRNLGFLGEEPATEWTPAALQALLDFQIQHVVKGQDKASGEYDDATQRALERVYQQQ